MTNQKLNKQLRLATLRQAKAKAKANGTKLNEKALASKIKPSAMGVGKAEAKAKAQMGKRCKLGYKGDDLLERKRINTVWTKVGVNLGDFYRPDRRTKSVTARG